MIAFENSIAYLNTTAVLYAVVEWQLSDLPCQNLAVMTGQVTAVSEDQRLIVLQDGSSVHYDRLCICSGATPQVIGVFPSDSAVFLACYQIFGRCHSVHGRGPIRCAPELHGTQCD